MLYQPQSDPSSLVFYSLTHTTEFYLKKSLNQGKNRFIKFISDRKKVIRIRSTKIEPWPRNICYDLTTKVAPNPDVYNIDIVDWPISYHNFSKWLWIFFNIVCCNKIEKFRYPFIYKHYPSIMWWHQTHISSKTIMVFLLPIDAKASEKWNKQVSYCGFVFTLNFTTNLWVRKNNLTLQKQLFSWYIVLKLTINLSEPWTNLCFPLTYFSLRYFLASS